MFNGNVGVDLKTFSGLATRYSSTTAGNGGNVILAGGGILEVLRMSANGAQSSEQREESSEHRAASSEHRAASRVAVSLLSARCSLLSALHSHYGLPMTISPSLLRSPSL